MFISSQNNLQKQFSILLKEKSQVEPCIKDTDNTATQFMILCDIIKQGDYALAFEKVIYFIFIIYHIIYK